MDFFRRLFRFNPYRESQLSREQCLEYPNEVAHRISQRHAIRSTFPFSMLEPFCQLNGQGVCFYFNDIEEKWCIAASEDSGAAHHVPAFCAARHFHIVWESTHIGDELVDSVASTSTDVGLFEPPLRGRNVSVSDTSKGCSKYSLSLHYLFNTVHSHAMTWLVLSLGRFHFYPVFSSPRAGEQVVDWLASSSAEHLNLSKQAFFFVPKRWLHDDTAALLIRQQKSVFEYWEETSYPSGISRATFMDRVGIVVVRWFGVTYFVLVHDSVRLTPYSKGEDRLALVLNHPPVFQWHRDALENTQPIQI